MGPRVQQTSGRRWAVAKLSSSAAFEAIPCPHLLRGRPPATRPSAYPPKVRNNHFPDPHILSAGLQGLVSLGTPPRVRSVRRSDSVQISNAHLGDSSCHSLGHSVAAKDYGTWCIAFGKGANNHHQRLPYPCAQGAQSNLTFSGADTCAAVRGNEFDEVLLRRAPRRAMRCARGGRAAHRPPGHHVQRVRVAVVLDPEAHGRQRRARHLQNVSPELRSAHLILAPLGSPRLIAPAPHHPMPHSTGES